MNKVKDKGQGEDGAILLVGAGGSNNKKELPK